SARTRYLALLSWSLRKTSCGSWRDGPVSHQDPRSGSDGGVTSSARSLRSETATLDRVRAASDMALLAHPADAGGTSPPADARGEAYSYFITSVKPLLAVAIRSASSAALRPPMGCFTTMRCGSILRA